MRLSFKNQRLNSTPPTADFVAEAGVPAEPAEKCFLNKVPKQPPLSTVTAKRSWVD